MLMMKDGVPRTPKSMRRELVKRGIPEDRVGSRSGNFYNSIFRLTNRNRLIKQPGGAYVFNSEEEEAAQ